MAVGKWLTYDRYRFIVPPARIDDRNIAFAGRVSSVSTASAANAQALWISTFFDGKLDRLASTPREVRDEVMLHTQRGKWRCPTGYGAILPNFVLDALPSIDLLLRDLGLKVNRKSSLFAKIWHPYESRKTGSAWWMNGASCMSKLGRMD